MLVHENISRKENNEGVTVIEDELKSLQYIEILKLVGHQVWF